MGYYSDTTAKLLDQIGNPYVTEVQSRNPAFDLSSLIMALAFMPKNVVGMNPAQEALVKGTAADVVGDIRGSAPSEISMGEPSIFPTIFDTTETSAVSPAAAAAAAQARSKGGLKVPFSLAPQRPSILGDPQQVLAFLKMLGIL